MMRDKATQNLIRALLGTTAAAIAVGLTVSVTAGVSAQEAASPSGPKPGTPEFFTQKVVPILDDNCYSCHQDDKKGGLRLDSYEAIRKGGKSGAIVVPGDLDRKSVV